MRELTEEMFDAYEECAIWSSLNEDDQDESGNPTPLGETCVTFTDRYAILARKDLEDFLASAGDLLTDAWSDVQIGHDFWLTRNGHGAGFWDSGLPNGDALSDIARKCGEVDLFRVGDTDTCEAM